MDIDSLVSDLFTLQITTGYTETMAMNKVGVEWSAKITVDEISNLMYVKVFMEDHNQYLVCDDSYWTIHRVERSASIACDVIGFQRILWLFIGQERFLLDVSMEMVVWLPVIVILMGSKKSIQALMNEYTSIIRYFTFYTTSNYRLCCVLQVRNESGTMHGRIARYSEIKQNNQVRKLWIGTGTSSGLPYPRTSSGPHPTKCILLPEAYRS
ncbi:hypothetical protein BDB01DRAFT_900721 [Pilobolus umbonatus]|nr:hypothetical protein BDB01DRAFT_900721 [Pilobolus umbonatus]